MLKKAVPFVGLILLGAIPQLSGAQEGIKVDYCDACDLAQTLHNLLEFMIIIGVIFSVLLFINAGVLYVTSSTNPGNIARAHKIFLNTVIGLIIMLASWLVIDVIMKTLYDPGETEAGTGAGSSFGPWNEIICDKGLGTYDMSDGIVSCGDTEACTLGEEGCVPADAGPIEATAAPAASAGGGGFVNGGTPDGSKVALDPNIPTKGAAACAEGYTCTVDASIADEVTGFMASLPVGSEHSTGGLGPGEVWITEMWPPTKYTPENPKGIHASQCHADGTCIDFNFKAGKAAATPEAIKHVQTKAAENGMKAVYETNDVKQLNALRAAGVENVIYVEQITSPHFSVYGNQND